jgi:predicted acetylornithine/succinylornithine family transaminase
MSPSISDFPEIAAEFAEYVMPTYARFPLCFTEGSGCRLRDVTGREYLDLGAGIAVSSLGHAHPRIVAAIREQVGQLVHISNLYYHAGQGKLAQKLSDCVGLPGKVFFANSGAEANEAAYKLARRYGQKAGAGGRYEIVTFGNSFHGRTIAGISATAQAKIKEGFGPLLEGFVHVPLNDLGALKAAITDKTAAVLLEPIQGEGGIHSVTPEFLRAVRALCDEHGLLLMFDEIQSGLGRTGAWCAWHTLGAPEVLPDVITWAKGLAGGYPLGAMWARKTPVTLATGETADLCDILSAGTHGTTYGGNPLACAAALAVLEEIESAGLLENATRLGAQIQDTVRGWKNPLIQEVRGAGLMIGIELVADFAALAKDSPGPDAVPSRFCTEELARRGLLVIPSGAHVLRLLPPLCVDQADLEDALGVLCEFLASQV